MSSSLLEHQNEAALRHGPCCYFLELRTEVLRKQGRIPLGGLSSDRHNIRRSQHSDSTVSKPKVTSQPMDDENVAQSFPSRRSEPVVKKDHFDVPPSVMDVNSQKLPTPGSMDVNFNLANEKPTFTGPQVECPYCYRSFNGDRIDRHVVACKKAQDSKDARKEFDTKALRIKKLYEDTAVNPDDVLRKIEEGDQHKKPPKKNWRKDSDRFQKMIRGEQLEPEADDRVPCPGCGRKFAATAAERHIPKCLDKNRR